MRQILDFLILPRVVSDFENRYLRRINRVALAFFGLHLPVFVLVAWCNDTKPGVAAILTAGVLVGPVMASFSAKSPRLVSVVHGMTAMFMGGLLVHFGQGPVQIEMHFYFFALIAMCAVFGNPLVIVGAAVTVALHHLIVWLVIPHSLFNYNAAWWVVAIHAMFVVLEATAACFISRSFFDNVIGLEKIVEVRTAALDAKNRDMRLLLDNVQQGFLTIDRNGSLAQERSAAVDRWFGEPGFSVTFFDYLRTVSPEFAEATRLGWGEVVSDVLPLELTLDQMPKRLTVRTTHFRFAYRPIGAKEPFERFLVIITDVTTEVEREQAECERREAMAIFERVLVDRSGCEAFFDEGSQVVELLGQGACDLLSGRRMLHTLKGNAALYGLSGIATLCHELENLIAETGLLPPPSAYSPLAERWGRLTKEIEKLLGRHVRAIEIDDAQYEALLASCEKGEPKEALIRKVRALRREPTLKRLNHFADQAKRVAEGLDKDLSVRVEDHGVRLSPRIWTKFWNNFIHAIRNAIDHGIESSEARVAVGKPATGTLKLSTFEDGERLVVEVEDDGRGIDWTTIAERARLAGLPSTTKDDLQRALFADGFSTAAAVSDISGRGVGMGNLLRGVSSLGGAMLVMSELGKGTCLRMTFPAETTVDAYLKSGLAAE